MRERERERERIISQREREIKENVKIFANGFPGLFGIRFIFIGIAFFYKRVKKENAKM